MGCAGCAVSTQGRVERTGAELGLVCTAITRAAVLRQRAHAWVKASWSSEPRARDGRLRRILRGSSAPGPGGA